MSARPGQPRHELDDLKMVMLDPDLGGLARIFRGFSRASDAPLGEVCADEPIVCTHVVRHARGLCRWCYDVEKRRGLLHLHPRFTTRPGVKNGTRDRRM